ncbi:MAG TPA: hypothetical protein VLB80_02215 [Candidatus Babeliales bacterium]|nr:hypothetical protein [Candidatus Babeliales bacterium]
MTTKQISFFSFVLVAIIFCNEILTNNNITENTEDMDLILKSIEEEYRKAEEKNFNLEKALRRKKKELNGYQIENNYKNLYNKYILCLDKKIEERQSLHFWQSFTDDCKDTKKACDDAQKIYNEYIKSIKIDESKIKKIWILLSDIREATRFNDIDSLKDIEQELREYNSSH